MERIAALTEKFYNFAYLDELGVGPGVLEATEKCPTNLIPDFVLNDMQTRARLNAFIDQNPDISELARIHYTAMRYPEDGYCPN